MLSKYILTSLLASAAAAVNTLEISGQDFVDPKTNKRFYVIGVEYVVTRQRIEEVKADCGAATNPVDRPATTRSLARIL